MRTVLLWLGLCTLFSLLPGVDAQDERYITDLAWSSDETHLAVGASDGIRVYAFEDETLHLLWQAATEYPVGSIAFSPSGKQLAVGMGNGSVLDSGIITIWESGSGQAVTSFVANRFAVYELTFSPDGLQLTSGGGYFPTRAGGDYRVRTWDTTTWEEIREKQNSGLGGISAVAFNSQGSYLAFSSRYGDISIISWDDNTIVASIHQNAGSIDFDDTAKRLILGSSRGIEVWNMRFEPEFHLVRQSQWAASSFYTWNLFQFRSDEVVLDISKHKFVTASDGDTLQVRLIGDGLIIAARPETGRRFIRATFNADETYLAYISSDAASQAQNTNQQLAIWKIGSTEAIYIDLDK